MDFSSYMTAEGIAQLSPMWISLLVVVIIWSAIWKMIALWKSARNNSLIWFIVLAVVNTIGILEILYIYVFSKRSGEAKVKPKRKKRR